MSDYSKPAAESYVIGRLKLPNVRMSKLDLDCSVCLVVYLLPTVPHHHCVDGVKLCQDAEA